MDLVQTSLYPSSIFPCMAFYFLFAVAFVETAKAASERASEQAPERAQVFSGQFVQK